MDMILEILGLMIKKYSKISKRIIRHIQNNKKIQVLITSIGMLFIVLFVCTGFANKQDTVNACEQNKYFKSVQVEENETVWDIASEYYSDEYDSFDDYIAEIESINSIDADYVKSGCYIVVPYYAE